MATAQPTSYYVPYQNSYPRFVQSSNQPAQIVSQFYGEEPLWLSARGNGGQNSGYTVKPNAIHVSGGGNAVLTANGLQMAPKVLNSSYAVNLPGTSVVRVANSAVMPSQQTHVMMAGGNKVSHSSAMSAYSAMDAHNNTLVFDNGVRRVQQQTLAYPSTQVIDAGRAHSISMRQTTGALAPQYTLDSTRQLSHPVTVARSKPVQLYQVPVGRATTSAGVLQTSALNAQFSGGAVPSSMMSLDSKGRPLGSRSIIQSVQYQPSVGPGMMVTSGGSALHSAGHSTLHVPVSQTFSGGNAVLTYGKPATMTTNRVPTQRYLVQPVASTAMQSSLGHFGRAQMVQVPQSFGAQQQVVEQRPGFPMRLASGAVNGHGPVHPASSAGQRVLDFSTAAAYRMQNAQINKASTILVPAGAQTDFANLAALKLAGATSQAAYQHPSISPFHLNSDVMVKVSMAPSLQPSFTSTVKAGPAAAVHDTLVAARSAASASQMMPNIANPIVPQEDFRVVLEYVGQHFARMKISIEAAVDAGLLGGLAEQEKHILCLAHARETEMMNVTSVSGVPTPRTPGSPSTGGAQSLDLCTSSGGFLSVSSSVGSVVVESAVTASKFGAAGVVPNEVLFNSLAAGHVAPAYRSSSHPSSPVASRAIAENRPSSAPPAAPSTPSVGGSTKVAISVSTADAWSDSSNGACSDAARHAGVEQQCELEVVNGVLPSDHFNAFEYGFFGDMTGDGGLLEALEPEQKEAAAPAHDAVEGSVATDEKVPSWSAGENDTRQVGVSGNSDRFTARFANLDLGCGFFS